MTWIEEARARASVLDAAYWDRAPGDWAVRGRVDN